MLFNSFEFLVFFPIVFILYWFVGRKSLSLQNALLLISSYIFYGWWDWRFVFLLALSTLIDYSSGLAIERSATRKKLFLVLSMTINLGLLGVFKYYDFFVDSAVEVFERFGYHPNVTLLNVVLPVGISFYTFHGMSYVIDIYYGRSKAITDFVSYAVFVCFFPLLVAGPIERAHHLLPQIMKPRVFALGQATDGIRLMIWGFFKKVVIADNLAPYVDRMFSGPGDHSGLELGIGVVFFAFQIYCDFSGYSDIAIGAAKNLGLELLVNFRTPYWSRDVAEFWRRWHISLTTWFRDYLYFPLGGSRGGKWQSVRNTFIVFVVSGFWHGANWTFIFWGALNALYFMPLLLMDRNRQNLDIVAQGRLLPSLKEAAQIVFTFALICVSWIFFRAATIGEAFEYIASMTQNGFMPETHIFTLEFASTVALIVVFLLVEWLIREKGLNEAVRTIRYRPVRYTLYYGFVLAVFLFGAFKEVSFIYFQF